MLKRRILQLSLALFVLVLFSSCELDSLFCKDCYIVTYNAQGVEEGREFYGNFCDDELAEVEGQTQTDPQGIKTVVECE